MKVVFVYKYLSLGGVEAVLRTRLRHLDRFGIDASCWFLHEVGGRGVFEGLEERIRVGTVGEFLDFVRRQVLDLVVSIDTEEILHAYDGQTLPPLVFEGHSAYSETLKNWRNLGSHAAAVVAPSAHHARLIKQVSGADAVGVVPNVVGDRFLRAVGPLPCMPPHPVVAWLGRLDDHKNWRLFVDVAAQLDVHPSRPEFWIAGMPVEACTVDHLREVATRRGVLPRVRWYCGLDHSCVPRLLDLVRESGGLTLTTSKAESFGMSIVESMARACPVVVPDQEPFIEFIQDGRSGLLYEPGSAADAAAKVGRILEDAGLHRRLGRAARAVVQERFSPDAAMSVLAQALFDVVESPRPRTIVAS